MFKIRFNLGRGENFKKWKIVTPNKNVLYVNPNEVILCLEEATLKNIPSISTNIFNGANKRICAWIECEKMNIFSTMYLNDLQLSEVSYNPRICPNWLKNGENVDSNSFAKLITFKNKVYHIENSYHWAQTK